MACRMGVIAQGVPSLLFKIACCSLPVIYSSLRSPSGISPRIHSNFCDLSSDIVTLYYSCKCGFMINEFSILRIRQKM